MEKVFLCNQNGFPASHKIIKGCDQCKLGLSCILGLIAKQGITKEEGHWKSVVHANHQEKDSIK